MISISTLLHRIAERNPNQVACTIPTGGGTYDSYSFAEISHKSKQLAHYFRKKGLHPGQRTLMMLKPSLEFVTTIFALFEIGALPVFIDPGMPKKSLLKTLKGCGATAAIAQPQAAWLLHLGILRVPEVRLILSIRGNFFKELEPNSPSCQSYQNINLDAPAAVLYTSGGTGNPKGVIYTQRIFLAQISALKSTFAFHHGEIEMAGFPLFSMLTMLLGVHSIIAPMNSSKPAKAPAKKLVRVITDMNIQTVSGSPAIWQRVTNYALKHTITLPCVRRVLMFGAPVRETMLINCRKVFPNAHIYTPYGATECLPIAVADHSLLLGKFLGATSQGRGTCIGKPVSGVQLKIIRTQPGDKEVYWNKMEELNPGEIGEIIVHSPCATPGYIDNTQATYTAKIYDPQGNLWHRMGDVAYQDKEGFIWFCGRSSHCFEENYPIPCEGHFQSHPKVNRAALIRLKRPGQKARAAIAIELKTSFFMPFQRRRVRQDLQKMIANYSQLQNIQEIVFCRKMPLDGRHNIKIDRLTLGEIMS
ncbi:MAG: AMP-binding protein [Zetaproteobacteria bacterium]|nr:AMP-binding protein [Zetaproteobacteria bacterium]